MTQLAKEQAEKKKSYDKFMKTGLKYYTAKNYTPARNAYEEALKLYPDDINALKKIKAIEKALADEEAALAEKEKEEIEDQYNQKIKESDELVSEKKYSEALLALNDANTILPNQQQTTSKINEVNELIQKIKF